MSRGLMRGSSKPNKSLDPDYEGQYDLWIEGVRVEVKSSRAVEKKRVGSLPSRAISYGSQKPFWMNFQQIKLDVCDVFVFVGVFVDRIIYWVLSNDEVKSNPHLSHQHRGGIEYQIGIRHRNIADFEGYRVEPGGIGDRVIQKGAG